MASLVKFGKFRNRTLSLPSLLLVDRKIRHAANHVGRGVTELAIDGWRCPPTYSSFLDASCASANETDTRPLGRQQQLHPVVSHNASDAWNLSEEVGGQQLTTEDIRELYRIVVPVMLTACLLSMLFNLLLLCSLRWVRRALSPTLCFSLSLAVADAYASLVVGVGLVVNSLLATVYGLDLGPLHECYVLILEAFRLGGLIVSVLHLLALAVNHYVGILRPLHYASTVTRRSAGLGIAGMWLFPVAFFFLYFSLVPGEGFQSPGCSNYLFLLYSTFRATVSFLFFIPLILMTMMYVHIFFVIRNHQKGLLNYPSTRQLHKNVKAIFTTLLILGTYLIGWMPAVAFFILTCLDCPVPYPTIGVWVRVPVSILNNSLIVAKSFVDPIIYVVRMPEVKDALKMMWKSTCGCDPGDSNSSSRSDHYLCSRTDTKRVTNLLKDNKKAIQPHVSPEKNNLQN